MSFSTRAGRLESAMVRLQERVKDLEADRIELIRQLSETNLRMLFVMRWFHFEQKPSATLVDAANHPIRHSVRQTLEAIYEHNKDQFLDRLHDEARHAKAEQFTADADDGQDAHTAAPPSSDSSAAAAPAEGRETSSTGPRDVH